MEYVSTQSRCQTTSLSLIMFYTSMCKFYDYIISYIWTLIIFVSLIKPRFVSYADYD